MLVVWGGYIMKKLNLIIILLIIFLIVLSVGILFTSGILQQSDNMKTIALSSTCTLDVIESDTNISTYADTVKVYNDTKNGICVVSYNSQEADESQGNALGGAVAFATMRDALTIGENLEDLNSFSLYKCDGYYSAKLAKNTTHDNIVIVCKDLDLLKKIVSSVKFTNNTVVNNNSNISKDSSVNNVNTSSDTHSNTSSDTGSNVNDKPDGVSDEVWESHLRVMEYRENNPYSAEDGRRFSTVEERNAYQSQLAST